MQPCLFQQLNAPTCIPTSGAKLCTDTPHIIPPRSPRQTQARPITVANLLERSLAPRTTQKARHQSVKAQRTVKLISPVTTPKLQPKAEEYPEQANMKGVYDFSYNLFGSQIARQQQYQSLASLLRSRLLPGIPPTTFWSSVLRNASLARRSGKWRILVTLPKTSTPSVPRIAALHLHPPHLPCLLS
ncbi:unnamed protein product [Peniophora sp. CBMAI 1063]|nr:unnamed protein product [Peniophora sp. CBMAI 1063]